MDSTSTSAGVSPTPHRSPTILPDIIIQSVAIEPDGGLQISFYRPQEDIKGNGVLHMHTLVIPADDDYDDEIEAVLEAARYAVRDVLEDIPNLEAATPKP